MAGLEQVSQNTGKEKALKVDIVRHGPSMYRQPEWTDIETANDINTLGRYDDGAKTEEEVRRGKEEAIEIVRETAGKIADEISPDEEVIIWSSPTGRTLETARIISRVLEERGIRLRKKGIAQEYGIKMFEQIGEVKNFSWSLFEPLMNGGEVEINGAKFRVDKALSNPEGLGYPDYFTSDALKQIPASVKQQWPEEYVAEIESFESFREVSERMTKALRRLKAVGDKHYRVIVVTHDALTGDIVKTFTSGEASGINPGQLISLERVENKLVVTRAGNTTSGNSEEDVAK